MASVAKINSKHEKNQKRNVQVDLTNNSYI